MRPFIFVTASLLSNLTCRRDLGNRITDDQILMISVEDREETSSAVNETKLWQAYGMSCRPHSCVAVFRRLAGRSVHISLSDNCVPLPFQRPVY